MQYSNYDAAIIAQCTPQGSGAIALLRLSGTNAFIVADSISKLSGNKILSEQKTHTIHYGLVNDKHGNRLDHVLFLMMRGPHSFTGQDTIEITCHNNPFIIQSILESAIHAGARIAQNGEFSRRAVLNNKMDIIQAEAINDLIHANTQQALKQSLSQLEGSFTSWIVSLEKQLIKALALSEASFEFIDEENMEFNLQIKNIVTTIIETITALKKTFDQQQHIRQGIRIAIIGSVNAGKSSLFNALLSKERAIVTNIAGTTRDSIEAGLYHDGNYWLLIDTAGLRTTNDIIEQMGIERSYQEAQKADIILLVFDGSQSISQQEQSVYAQLINQYEHKILFIQNKSDLPHIPNQLLTGKNSIICSSALLQSINTQKQAHNNINAIESAIENKIKLLFESIESPFLLNQRHYNALLALEADLMTILPMLNNAVAYELVSYHIRDALATLSELTGKSISEAGMDAVFREFCVGK